MNLIKMETMFVKWISACICRLILFSHWTIDRMRLASFLFYVIIKYLQYIRRFHIIGHFFHTFTFF